MYLSTPHRDPLVLLALTGTLGTQEARVRLVPRVLQGRTGLMERMDRMVCLENQGLEEGKEALEILAYQGTQG